MFGSETDPDAYWAAVKTNLKAGRVRMLIVADQVPAELRQVVELLNEQMDPAEILALELRRYQGEEVRTLVPRVFGLTGEAQQRKGVSGSREPLDEASYFEQAASILTAPQSEALRRLYAFFAGHADEVRFGRSSFNARYRALEGRPVA